MEVIGNRIEHQDDGVGTGMQSHMPLTPVTLLERSALAHPNQIALVYPGGNLSYRTLCERSQRLAQALRVLNIAQGDRVAVWAENNVQTAEAHFAVPGAGGVLVMLSPWLSEADVISLLEFSEAKVLITQTRLYQALSPGGRQRLDGFLRVLLIQQPGDVPSPGALDYEQCLSLADGNVSLEQAVVSEFDPIAINFTSGTTGRPKGVIYSHRAAYLHAMGQVLMLGLDRESKYLWTLPMFHVNGWGHMWACAAVGCTQVVPSTHLGREHAAEFNALVQQHGITHLAGAPRLLKVLAEAHRPYGALSGMTIMTGGSAPSPLLIQQLESVGVNLIHQYGLNETCGPFVVCETQTDWGPQTPAERAQLRARQGVPAIHAGTGVQVRDARGEPVPHDGRSLGEVTMAGNTLASGYFKNREATEKAFRNGWFYSGDMAVVHPDGYLEIRDRIKDLIYVETDYGWENISSIEVENVLSHHPAIQDIAVVGIASSEGLDKGPLLVAFVERRAGTDISEFEFKAYCATALSAYKRPQRVFFEPLPKTHTGKIRKDVLSEEAGRRLKAKAVIQCGENASTLDFQ